MTQHMPPQSMSLYDLIGRSWELGGEVRRLLFNRDQSSVLAQLANGQLAFLRVEDAEDPDKRMRMELETGRSTIRPREKPLPQPVLTEAGTSTADVCIATHGASGFAFASENGAQHWRATARGQTLRESAEGGVTALADLPGDGQLVARGARLGSADEDAMTTLDHLVTRLSPSPDGAKVACAGEGKVSLLEAATMKVAGVLACESPVSVLAWSPDGRWLIGGCEGKALLVVDAPAATSDRIVDFPAPVRSVAFSRAAGALLAAGAFRAVGWKLPDLPFGNHEGTPLETGKPGLTLVEAVAAHPSRDLCATGYANGLVTICQIGTKQELMLREGDGRAVTALAWSGDGKHLAIGTAGGKAAIVTFPKHMFK